jgi:hypothetical protein
MSEERAVDVDQLAAVLRADGAELESFGEALAAKLEEALPASTRVQRRRTGLLGPKRVHRIAIAFPDETLELVCDGGRMEASRARMSGGITLKRERLGLDAWLQELSRALAAEAARSEQARRALEQLLI